MASLRRYYFRLFLFSLLLFAGSIVFAHLAGSRMVSDVHYLFVPFFTAVASLAAYMHHKSLGRKHGGFTHFFVGITMARFILFLLIMVAYAIIFRDDAARFIIWFMVFYLLYTFFEMGSLYRMVRKRE
jgi:hypothetical protein